MYVQFKFNFRVRVCDFFAVWILEKESALPLDQHKRYIHYTLYVYNYSVNEKALKCKPSLVSQAGMHAQLDKTTCKQ